MIGTTLGDIREHIEALASEMGEYYLVCGRCGDRPVPAADLRFQSRPTARAAARATEQYRTALRRYDPQLPYYDVIVCQETTCTASTKAKESQFDEQSADPGHNAESITQKSGRQSLVDFCHTVAGAVFETVAVLDHGAVEQAIMDTYFTVAEKIDSPDELCLCLLESMATVLDQRLTPDKQARLLVSAAARLPVPASNENPLDATLSHLCSVTLATDYTVSHCSIDPDHDVRSWDVTLSGYAFDRSEERFTTLPLIISLLRRRPDPALTVSNVRGGTNESALSTWWFRLTSTTENSPTGLVCVPEVFTK